MSTVALRAAGLTKRYGSVRALDGLDLEVGVGEVHAFLGPNGAGKTTTIRILLGLLRKDGGEVSLLGGDPWRDAVELHQRLAYVPGDVTLWPNLTGGESIDLLGRLRGGINAGLIGLRHRDLGDLGPSRPLGAVRDRIVVYESFEPSRQAAEHE
jgi:ABC-2 type transport system ATP-binding protein